LGFIDVSTLSGISFSPLFQIEKSTYSTE